MTMARPTKYDEDRTQVQIRLTDSIRARLEKEAVRRRVSKTFLIEQMVIEQLPKWEKQKITNVA
jgi:hypothetical protein